MNDLTALVIIVCGVAALGQFGIVVIALINRDNKPLMDKLIAMEGQLVSIEEKAIALAEKVATNKQDIATNTENIANDEKNHKAQTPP